MKLSIKQLSRAAVTAALYAMLCLLLKPLCYGSLQIRLSEALCVLPAFMPEAVLGLFIGCVISNFFGGASLVVFDVVFGSLTTLFSAILTRFIYKKTKKLSLSLLPPVILNAVIVGSYIPFVYTSPDSAATLPTLLLSVLTVGAGEFSAVYIIGMPFASALRKIKFLNVK